MKFKEQNKKHRFWMNLAFGYIVALFISVVVLFFNLSSIYISVSCFTICFITVVGAKICFARADQYEASASYDETEEVVTNEAVVENETMEPLKVETSQELDATEQLLENEALLNEEVAHTETLDIIDGVTDESSNRIEASPMDVTVSEASETIIDVTEVEMHRHEALETVVTTTNSESELDTFEQEILDQITSILIKHNRDVASLSTKKVGNYFDVQANSTIVRFKLKGRKQYLLAHLEEAVLTEKGLTVEAPSKNEKFSSRVILTSSDVLHEISDYIVENFDKAC